MLHCVLLDNRFNRKVKRLSRQMFDRGGWRLWAAPGTAAEERYERPRDRDDHRSRITVLTLQLGASPVDMNPPDLDICESLKRDSRPGLGLVARRLQHLSERTSQHDRARDVASHDSPPVCAE